MDTLQIAWVTECCATPITDLSDFRHRSTRKVIQTRKAAAGQMSKLYLR